MLYNAIIRDYIKSSSVPTGGSVGKLLLPDLKQVPQSWIIHYRGRSLERTTKLENHMCCSTEPIQIFRTDPSTAEIYVQTLTNKTFKIPNVNLTETAETLKQKIQFELGIPPRKQRLVFRGKQLEDGRSLKDYKIKDGDILFVVLRLWGGGGISTVNLEAKQITGRGRRGTPATHSWQGYTIGLNLYGVCPNANCNSKSTGNSSQKVVVSAHYGLVSMTRERNKFACPACKSDAEKKQISEAQVGMFTPTNFVVSFGRSLFQFKKTGLGQPVKRVLMESLGLDDNFKTFDDSEGAQSEYDFIEVTTAGKYSSPYFCIKCEDACKAPGRDYLSEMVLPCGHAYHRGCAPANETDCFVCKAEVLNSIMDLVPEDGEEYTGPPYEIGATGNSDDNGNESEQSAYIRKTYMEFKENVWLLKAERQA